MFSFVLATVPLLAIFVHTTPIWKSLFARSLKSHILSTATKSNGCSNHKWKVQLITHSTALITCYLLLFCTCVFTCVLKCCLLLYTDKLADEIKCSTGQDHCGRGNNIFFVCVCMCVCVCVCVCVHICMFLPMYSSSSNLSRLLHKLTGNVLVHGWLLHEYL